MTLRIDSSCCFRATKVASDVWTTMQSSRPTVTIRWSSSPRTIVLVALYSRAVSASGFSRNCFTVYADKASPSPHVPCGESARKRSPRWMYRNDSAGYVGRMPKVTSRSDRSSTSAAPH